MTVNVVMHGLRRDYKRRSVTWMMTEVAFALALPRSMTSSRSGPVGDYVMQAIQGSERKR